MIVNKHWTISKKVILCFSSNAWWQVRGFGFLHVCGWVGAGKCVWVGVRVCVSERERESKLVCVLM